MLNIPLGPWNERLHSIYGTVFIGTVDTVESGSETTTFYIEELARMEDDYFNNHYYLTIMKAGGAAPEGETRLITDYVSASGGFVVNALSADIEADDIVLIVHESVLDASRNGGLVLKGACNVGMTGSTTDLYSDQLAGYGNDFFNTKYYAQVIKNTNSVGNAPEREVRAISDYVSATGKIVCAAFSANVEASDEIMILHESIVALGRDDNSNAFASTNVAADADGSILERLEWIQVTLGGAAIQLRTQQSGSNAVEENSVQQFNIYVGDVDAGAIAEANIDIGSISAVLEKSTGGGAFDATGITQPTFLKGDGSVYCAYQFLAAQWAAGDMYKLVVSGITATVDGDVAYVPTMVWSNLVVEDADVKSAVDDINADLGEPEDAETSTLHGKVGTDTEMADRSLFDLLMSAGPAAFPAAADPANDVSLGAVLRGILTSLVGSDDYDGYTNISNSANVSINAIFQKFAVLFAADGVNSFNPTIQGAARTDLELALAALATYISASGGALSIQVNNNDARTDLEQALEDYFAVIGCDGANVFNPSIGGTARTTLEAALAAIGTALGAEFDGTPDLYDVLMTGLDSSAIANNFDGGILEVLKAGLEKTTTGAFDPDTDSNEAIAEIVSNINTNVGDLSGHTLISLALKWGDIARNLDLILGSRWDASGDLGTDIASILTAVAPAWKPQADVAVDITAINGSETNVFDLSTASTSYMINNLRLKAADPGANTITVKLYELINDALTVVDTFSITTDNYGTYVGLVDMFGTDHLAGDSLKITVQCDAGGPYAITGQYHYSTATT